MLQAGGCVVPIALFVLILPLSEVLLRDKINLQRFVLLFFFGGGRCVEIIVKPCLILLFLCSLL